MRSKIYKKILVALPVVVVLFIVAAYSIGLQSKNHSIKLQESDQNPAVQNSTSDNLANFKNKEVVPENNSSQNENFQPAKSPTSNSDVSDENLIQVSVKVQDKIYATKIKDGSSVYDLMNQLKFEGLNFSATEYSSLGFFVTEINGVKENRKTGTYWTLYVNDKEAITGASQLILKTGDLIEWKYENRNNY